MTWGHSVFARSGAPRSAPTSRASASLGGIGRARASLTRTSLTRTWLAWAGLALVLAFAFAALAAPNFPALTGRVVDQANVIPPATRVDLETKLADLEMKSGIQLVVATVSSLDGEEIEPYANELFRTWKLGEKAKNNGVLLLVAPKDRRVRIEVGYGLEGTLTDALSKVIITNAIAPRFKAGNYGEGITRGVDDIITVLTTDASEWQQRPSLRLDHDPSDEAAGWLLLGFVLLFFSALIFWPAFRCFCFNLLLNVGFSAATGGFSGGGGGGGGGDGGGFSGGGGSSGGGGASGSW
jgi:uncharacterized protein